MIALRTQSDTLRANTDYAQLISAWEAYEQTLLAKVKPLGRRQPAAGRARLVGSNHVYILQISKQWATNIVHAGENILLAAHEGEGKERSVILSRKTRRLPKGVDLLPQQLPRINIRILKHHIPRALPPLRVHALEHPR